MSDLALAVRQAGYGLKTLTRNPRALVFGVIFPVILFVMFASIFAKGGDETTRINGEEIGADAYFAAGMIAWIRLGAPGPAVYELGYASLSASWPISSPMYW